MKNEKLLKELDSEFSMNVKQEWSIPTVVDLDVNLTEGGKGTSLEVSMSFVS